MGSKKNIIIAGLFIFAVILIVAYISAAKKSEPIYLSKIDKIMFDSKNKSPKFVITLPDKDKKEIEKRVVKEEKVSGVQKVDLKNLLQNIPSLKKLEPITNILPLRFIDLDKNLVEEVNRLKLPQKHGHREAWFEYGRRTRISPNFYKVSVVVKKMGLDENLTSLVYKNLPSNISLSFSPYSKNTAQQIKEARKFGHETYIDIILLSHDFRLSDTGPKAINPADDEETIISRLHQILNIDAPIGGVVMNRGIYTDEGHEQVQKMLVELNNRGLLMLDSTENDEIDTIKAEGLARRRADIVIENNFDKRNIAQQLEKAEKLARENGHVLIITTPKPSALMAINEWIKTFSPELSYEESISLGLDPNNVEKPFALVPASAVVVNDD